MTSSEGIKTVALNNTRCPANQVRWFNCRLSITSELPSSAQVTSIARVTKRIDNTCFIELFTDSGETWTNAYNGSSWSGWEKLALDSKFALHQATVSGLSIQEFKSDVINLILVTGTASDDIQQWRALTNISGRKPVINTAAFYGGNFQVQADNGNLVASAAIASGAFIRSLIAY